MGLECPRCKSTNTRFQHFNNYNPNQPRHICTACKRSWTQGGKLRDIPIDGGENKNQCLKCPRCCSTNTKFQRSNPFNPDHPRHFCNSCKRSWLHGGKLKNIAVDPRGENQYLQCPRCQSTNTKFRSFDNYNPDQPRHFCKACKRSWKVGGKLRDTVGHPRREDQYLQCPRCQSSNTIFQGYNNNNPDQRRRLCKECKRTWRWRQGGELGNTKGVEEEGPSQ